MGGDVNSRFATACALLMLATQGALTSEAPMPHLRDKGETRQLIVEGKPFLILGGELGNSTASDLSAH